MEFGRPNVSFEARDASLEAPKAASEASRESLYSAPPLFQKDALPSFCSHPSGSNIFKSYLLELWRLLRQRWSAFGLAALRDG